MSHLDEQGTQAREAIDAGETALGLELGSTRIKAALIGPAKVPIATGAHDWSNRLVDGLWTYDLADVHAGVQSCFASLATDVSEQYETTLKTAGALGCSAMMHGYLAFDDNGELLVPFRTWRNTNTDAASKALTDLFDHNIPHRWSIAHLYQAVLDDEEHLPRVARITTLAGYVHQQLTGNHVVGVGDASGMFPIDVETGQFDESMIDRFDSLVADRGYPWRLAQILPTVQAAGEDAGTLTSSGARFLDPTGSFRPGTPLCPPEGDAGTGMVATNSVAPGTGNVSAGTSIFAMAVLESRMRSVHADIDLVTTPAGDPVAMVHCNNGTGDLDAWVAVFGEFATALGVEAGTGRLFEALFTAALSGDADGGGLLAYNYLSGEPITGVEQGRPLFARTPDSRFTLANFARTQLYSIFGALRAGMEILREENAHPHELFAHGGLFTTKGVGQRILAAALDTPVSVGELAAEGGPWGMALLAAYRRERGTDQALADYLAHTVFETSTVETIAADAAEVEGFNVFMKAYRQGLPLAREAAARF